MHYQVCISMCKVVMSPQLLLAINCNTKGNDLCEITCFIGFLQFQRVSKKGDLDVCCSAEQGQCQW